MPQLRKRWGSVIYKGVGCNNSKAILICSKKNVIDPTQWQKSNLNYFGIKEKDIEHFCNEGILSLSLHDLNLADILKLARAMKLKTDITIIGIKPLNIEFGEELSPEIQEKIPEIISLVEKTLKQYKNT